MYCRLTQVFLAFSLLFICGVSGLFFNSLLKITTSKKKVIVGSEFTVNCTLTKDYHGPLNASFLYFEKPNKRTKAIERVLGDKLSLEIASMQKNDSGIYKCYLNETSIGRSENATKAFTAVNVGEPPAPVTNVSCVADNFETMNCSWCPEDMRPMIKWKMHWTAGSVSGVCNKGWCWCRFSHDSSASGKTNPFIPNISYLMNFMILNDYGTVRSVAVVRTTQHIVKLRRLRHLEAVSYTSRSVKLNWSEPDGYDPKWFDVVYEIECKGPWTDEPKVTVELTNVRTHQLTGLHPYTKYSVTVRSRPAAGHLWSDPLTINVTTAMEVPSVAPTIPSGSFRTQPSSENKDGRQNVTVFWQLIPAKYQNGVMLGYEVSFHKVDGFNSSTSKVKTTLPSVTLSHLDGRHGYTVNVQAYNSAGKSPAATIFIPSRDELLQLPVDIVAERSENRSHISFSWAPPTAPVDNYTFLWCEALGQHACQGPIQSRVVAGNVTELEHAVRHYGDMYTLTVNTATGSSGMGHDWICVYDYFGLPGRPVFSFDNIGARNVSLSWQQPVCSRRNRGRVLSYKLELWKDNHEEKLEEFELPANAESYTISTLHPDTNYTIKMAAMTREGHGDFSVKQVHTLESKPDDPPTNLEGHLVSNHHQVALSWSKPRTSNGVIREYEVIARTNGVGERHEKVRGTNYMLEVDGGATYNFTVVAINAFGRSPEATPIIIMTPVRAPSQIHEIRVMQFNESVAMVNWAPPLPQNGPIDKFIVQCDLRNEGHAGVMTCNESVPGNETKMHVFINCSDAKVFLDVRVLAVNYNGTEPLYGDSSDAKTVQLCKNPGGATNWIWIIIICVAVIAVPVVVVVAYCTSRYRRLIKKPLGVIMPDQVSCTRGLIKGENEHSGTISPDGLSLNSANTSVIYTTHSLTNHDNTSAATCNTQLMPHDVSCERYSSGSGQNGYAKALFVSDEPEGPAVRLFPESNSSSNQFELQELPPARKIIDDTPQATIIRDDRDSADICWNNSTNDMKVCNGDLNRPNHQLLQHNPVEVTVFTAARQPDTAARQSDTAAELSRDDQSASSETRL